VDRKVKAWDAELRRLEQELEEVKEERDQASLVFIWQDCDTRFFLPSFFHSITYAKPLFVNNKKGLKTLSSFW
jgi:hypothetical protein